MKIVFTIRSNEYECKYFIKAVEMVVIRQGLSLQDSVAALKKLAEG